MSIDEELKILDTKLNQLKLGYEQYFMGSRPREPMVLRREVDRAILLHSNHPIKNTACRFRFTSICSRYQAFKRQWNDILRQMEQGTYSRQRFRADLHERQRDAPQQSAGPGGAPAPQTDPLFQSYLEARRQCGQAVDSLTPDRLEQVLAKQRQSLRERYGDSEFCFRVVVEDGRAKLKARRVGDAR